jgi:hypothetical protein
MSGSISPASCNLPKVLVPVLLAIILALLAFIYFDESSAEPNSGATSAQIAKGAGDHRTAVSLPPEHVAHVLGEMRGLMTALSDIQSARTTDDLAAIATAAEQQSPGQRGKPPAGLREAMPEAFRLMSQEMRQDFALVADAAAKGDRKAMDRHLSSAMAKCVACHGGYRLETRR